ncbi:MAG: hypothetical protein ABL896_07685 [Hylemonella sp.]
MNYSKTDVGQQAFKERSPALSARQRSAFILFDGVKTLEQVLAATAGLGVTPADVAHMVAQGFLVADAAAVAAAEAATAAATARSARTPQERYAEAYPLATRLMASLGLRGFKLNLAVEGASGYEDLLALLPKIQAAVGHEACRSLEQALLA